MSTCNNKIFCIFFRFSKPKISTFILYINFVTLKKYQPKKYTNLDKKYFLGRINSGKAIIHEMAIIVKIRKLNTIDLIKFTAN